VAVGGVVSPPSSDQRILVVDDSPAVQRLVTAVLNAEPNMRVVGAAADGRQALDLLNQCDPDVIVLDLEMPGMDGPATFEALRAMGGEFSVVVFTGASPPSDGALGLAIAQGAVAAVTKPTGVAGLNEAFERMRSTLLPAIRTQLAAAGSNHTPVSLTPTVQQTVDTGGGQPDVIQRRGRVDAVVIGSSTGGPDALDEFFTALGGTLPVPVFVVQHISANVTAGLARRLRKAAPTTVEALDGQTPQPGGVYLAPGDRHMTLTRNGSGTVVIRLVDTPPVNSCRPAVDVLFESAAETYRSNQVGIVMTGMGRDGVDGSRKLAEQQATVLAQDAESSVIWGMPGAVVKAGLADRVLPVTEMARLLNQWLSVGRLQNSLRL
jgi:two-component system chemotaxis response regulator CheB